MPRSRAAARRTQRAAAKASSVSSSGVSRDSAYLSSGPEHLADEAAKGFRALDLEQQPEGAQRAVGGDLPPHPAAPREAERLARLVVGAGQLGDRLGQVADPDRGGPGAEERRRRGMELVGVALGSRQVGRHLLAQQHHRRGGARQGEGAAETASREVGQRGVDPVLAAAGGHLRLGGGVVRLQHDDPGAARQPVAEPFRLAGQPFRLGVVEPAGEQLLDEVAAEPALDLRGRALLGHLEGQHGRAVLEGAEPAVGPFGVDLRHRHDQQAEEVGAGPNRDKVQLACRAPGAQPHLGGTVLAEEVGRQVEAAGQRVALLHAGPDPEAVDRVEPRPAAGEAADRFEDGRDPGAVEGQLGEAAVDLVREPDLGQLGLEPALQLHPFEDPGHLAGDRLQEVDVRPDEVAPLGALDVEHADQPVARLDRDRKHRAEPLLVDAGDPLEAPVGADVRHGEVLAVLRDPAGDAGADPQWARPTISGLRPLVAASLSSSPSGSDR